jgi:hypothetical protein
MAEKAQSSFGRYRIAFQKHDSVSLAYQISVIKIAPRENRVYVDELSKA